MILVNPRKEVEASMYYSEGDVSIQSLLKVGHNAGQ
jgi:hypothetical protein